MQKTVMVVDDSETDLLLTRLVLERAGLADRLLLMGSAAQALAHLDGPAPGVDLILLDVHMPGLDGFAFLDRHALHGGLAAPVVMLSASSDPADRVRALAHGLVRDFLSKPLDPTQVARLLIHLQA